MAKLVIFLVFYFFTGDILAQSQNKIFDYVVSGNYEAVQQSFTQQVDIWILSYEALVNKNEATAKLKEFFSKNKPLQYTFKHKGNSRANQSAYLVADLYTQNGMFRMFVYLSEKNGVTLVNEFRIEKSWLLKGNSSQKLLYVICSAKKSGKFRISPAQNINSVILMAHFIKILQILFIFVMCFLPWPEYSINITPQSPNEDNGIDCLSLLCVQTFIK
mgnify:CR=1 FL=1